MASTAAVFHPFFEVFRGVFLTVAAVQLALFSLQCYWDREQMTSLSKVLQLKTHRVFRINGLAGTLVSLISGLDTFSVFGILSSNDRLILICVAIFFSWTALCVACYHSVAATFIFMPFDSDRSSTLLTVVAVVMCVAQYLVIVLGFALPSRALALATLLVTIISFLVLIFGVNIVYYFLRRHRQAMVKFEATKTEKSKSFQSFGRLMKKWRNYAIVLNAVLSVGIFSFAYSMHIVAQKESNEGLGDTFADYDPSVVPENMPAIVMPFVSLAFFTVMLWRSWRSPGKISLSRKRTASSDGSGQRNGSGSALHSNARASGTSGRGKTRTSGGGSSGQRLDSSTLRATISKRVSASSARPVVGSATATPTQEGSSVLKQGVNYSLTPSLSPSPLGIFEAPEVHNTTKDDEDMILEVRARNEHDDDKDDIELQDDGSVGFNKTDGSHSAAESRRVSEDDSREQQAHAAISV